MKTLRYVVWMASISIVCIIVFNMIPASVLL